MIQPVKEKIILGIDPGTNIMGYGVLKVTGVKPEVMTLGVIDLRKGLQFNVCENTADLMSLIAEVAECVRPLDDQRIKILRAAAKYLHCYGVTLSGIFNIAQSLHDFHEHGF